DDWFANYHTYEDIKKWYIKHSNEHPGHVKFVPSIGKTWKNNDIFAVHLSNPNSSPNGKPKNKIWFQSLIHAREWISGPTTQYIFNEFLKTRDTDPKVKKILDENEIIFIPVVNPDGYKFTNIFRFWRKNLFNLHGVDINRNFPYRWGGPGASTNPLEDNYRGTGPASELETQAIINYYKKQGKIAGAIDFHSFSQLVLRPWGDNKEDTPHESVLKKLGDGIRDIIKQSRGTEYTSQKASELYEASGGADDWFYGEGKSYSFTLELSPKNSLGPLGFVLPPSEIKPVGKEIYPAI
ncbi:peptidase M14, carboxypeptidase A, partial [Conidiobolus coronatus NRRL 28638]